MFNQKPEVGSPVSGQDYLGAGGHDGADIGSKILAGDRVKDFTHYPCAFRLYLVEFLPETIGCLTSESIVLSDDVIFFELGVFFNDILYDCGRMLIRIQAGPEGIGNKL